MTTPYPPSAEYFDEWYADMAVSPAHTEVAEVARRTLGLPPELESTSLLSWDGIADVVHALRVAAGDVVVDLACGRGGYGLEVARRTGARLIGVDVAHQPAWRAAERAHWDTAVALDPGPDPALQSLHAEGQRVLPVTDRAARVLARATAPGAS